MTDIDDKHYAVVSFITVVADTMWEKFKASATEIAEKTGAQELKILPGNEKIRADEQIEPSKGQQGVSLSIYAFNTMSKRDEFITEWYNAAGKMAYRVQKVTGCGSTYAAESHREGKVALFGFSLGTTSTIKFGPL